ncbi:flagellar biosynthesis protein FlgD [Polynucleobacter sp. AP-Elch-400A-B2]|uniref:flagellar hook assembly protein FlgD n=1 Tax=Polynucleobacter sp. AP-Elch-400A-B2 TaxID=2576930 RepID=UPI001BFE305F|nr:FlgD immunoglobulin-like domain containing protein [Polynucleobacter sp. AP-Elch-400A-B2]QWE25115.1 flagellar biosynthesis protein FlgD [Polynucleobacter sp. AP-Elch-400A-B2]
MTTTGPMSNIPVYDPTVAASSATSSSSGTSAADQTQNFLKLLIAQIKNQDPMSPMDASTMTAQMSQLNMVTSMSNMNTSMTAMLNQMQSVNFMNQASLIGHSPEVAGNSISFDGTNSVVLGANAANPLTAVMATITDASGNIVNTASLGTLVAGMKNFAWDGVDASGNKVAAGNYSISISGTNTAGATESPTVYVASPVAAVSKGANGDSLLTLVDGRQINASTIQQWIN